MDLSMSQQPARPSKRIRSAFTTQQIELLEQQFKENQYITNEHRKQLAFALKIQERAVKIWFQNRRMREKKDNFKEYCERNRNKASQGQLDNVYALPSVNDRPSIQVRSANVVDKPVGVEPKAKTTVFSRISEPLGSVNVKSIKPKTKTTVLSHFFHPLLSVSDKPFVNDNQEDNSRTVLSKFFQQYKHSSASSSRNPAGKTINKNAVSTSRKNYSVLTNCKTYNMKALQNFARKNVGYKVKSRSNSSAPTSTPKTKTISKMTKTTNVQKPLVVPVMHPMYTSISSPASIVWKPVNILPGHGTPVNTYSIPQVSTSQQKKCCCNCTESQSSSPAYSPEGVNINNPYQSYILSLPYQSHCPSY